MKKAVFFDLDGTLIDSAPDLANSLNHTLESLNLPTYDLETIRSWIGGGATKLLMRGISGKKEAKNIDDQLLTKAKAIFFDHYKNHLCVQTRLYEGSKEILHYLKPKYKLALITNKPYPFVRPILQRLGIDIFDLVLGGESLPQKKPHPLPLVHACEHFGIRPHETVMVGDSSNDFIAAQKAGIEIVLVSYGYEKNPDLHPTYKIDTLLQLKEIV